MTYSTYSNQNSFGYQANSFSNYYQKEAIAQREKQVTDYLDFIADSRINNQSQHDTLVALGTLIYDLREVYIIQDANQNKFYDDNRYLEFVNRQLTAFKDRVLVNYQHYLNLAPSFAPQYLEQNITILHELSHGQYSPIRRLNLEHQPIYSFDYYGQAQATFFSTQQQQNLETMMSYRPGIWTPAPPPVSLFSIAGYSNYHDPYNFYSSNPAKSHSYSPSVVKSQGSPENYFVKGELNDRVSQGQESRNQGIVDSDMVSDLGKVQAKASLGHESDAGGGLTNEFEVALEDILAKNSFQEGGSQSDTYANFERHISPHLDQKSYEFEQGIKESRDPSFFQFLQHSSDNQGGGGGLSQKVAEGRASLRETNSRYSKEVQGSGVGSDEEDHLKEPTNYFANHYTVVNDGHNQGEVIGEEHSQSTSPVSANGEEHIDKSLIVEADSKVDNSSGYDGQDSLPSDLQISAQGQLSLDDNSFSSGSLDDDSSAPAGAKRRGRLVSWGLDVKSQDGSESSNQVLGGDSLASGPRLLRRQGRPFLQGSDGNHLVVVTRSSPFQGAHAEGQSFGNRQNSDYIVTFYNGNAPHRSRLQGIPEEDYFVDSTTSPVTSDVSKPRSAGGELAADLVFAREYSQGGPGNTRRLRSEERGMTHSQTGPERMYVPSDLRVDRRSLDEATATAELVFASDPVAISQRPAVRNFEDPDNPQGRSTEDSSIDRRSIPFNAAKSKFLLGGYPRAISLGGSQTTTRYPV